jgi:hypothetical protein
MLCLSPADRRNALRDTVHQRNRERLCVRTHGDKPAVRPQSQWTYTGKDQTLEFKTGDDVLKNWDDRPIPYSASLQVLYWGIFISAECALAIVALREYINDTRHVCELEWMFGKQDAQALTRMQESIQARLQSETRSPS